MYAVSPNGKEVAYTSNIDEVEAASTNTNLFVVPITGGAPEMLTLNRASDSTPLYSPDGKYIAYRAPARAGYESDRFRLMLIDRERFEWWKIRSWQCFDIHCPVDYYTRIPAEDFDHWVKSFAWAPDSKTIHFTAGDKGEVPIYAVDVSGGPVRELTRGSHDSLAITPDGKTLVSGRWRGRRGSPAIRACSVPVLTAACRSHLGTGWTCGQHWETR